MEGRSRGGGGGGGETAKREGVSKLKRKGERVGRMPPPFGH